MKRELAAGARANVNRTSESSPSKDRNAFSLADSNRPKPRGKVCVQR
jgi:hypothetical protein